MILDLSLVLAFAMILWLLNQHWRTKSHFLSNRLQETLRNQSKEREENSRARELLEGVLSNVSDPVMAVDLKGELIFYNPQFACFFCPDLDKAESSNPNRKLGAIIRSPELQGSIDHCMKMERKTQLDLELFIQQDLNPRAFSISIAPLHNQGNPEPYGIVGLFHDVSKLKAAEQLRIDFVANVSHELRTPLTAIKGYSTTIKGDLAGKLAESTQNYLGAIERNVERLTHLVNDLLDLSTIESAPDGGLKKMRFDLKDLTEKAFYPLRPRFEEKGQKLKFHYEVDSLYADPGRTEQVLTNLLENSCKYVPPKGTIEVIWQKDAGGVILKVSDNGPGIALEHQGRLFERFYRIDKSRSREQGGTGLGLAIVKHIMQKHGGSATVRSTPGHGAAFLCRFPDTDVAKALNL